MAFLLLFPTKTNIKIAAFLKMKSAV